MQSVWIAIGWFFFYLALVVGLICIPLGLGGTFIILGAALVVALITRFEMISVWAIVVMAALAIIGEIIESFLGMAAARKFGASKWAMGGTFVGGILGAMAGTSLMPVVGSLVVSFIGCFAGAFIAEVIYRRQLHTSLRAGWGAFLGRIFSVVIKFQIGIIMIIIIWIQLHGMPG